MMVKNSFPRKIGRQVPCAQCGRLFELETSRQRYCSELCRKTVQRKAIQRRRGTR